MAKIKWQDKYKGRTSNMLIDPFFEGSYIDEYPILQSITCTVGDVNYDNFIRSCSFILDPCSPIINEHSDLKERREVVYDMLKYFGRQDKDFEVALLITLYRKNDWTLYCSEQSVFQEFIERLNMPILKGDSLDEKKQMDAVLLKDKYLDSCDKLIARLEARYKKIFLFDEELEKRSIDVISSIEEMAQMDKLKKR